MMHKVKARLLVTLGLLLALLTACGDKGAQPEAAETLPDLSQPAEIVMFAGSGASEEAVNFRLGDAIRQKFPHYTLTWLDPGGNIDEKLKNFMTSGTRFDMFFRSNGLYEASVFPYQFYLDHTELMKRHQVDTSVIEPTALDAARQASEGKFYGLPVYTEYFVLFYNKTLFDKFGVPYPKDGMFWDELVDLSRMMTRTDGETQYYGFASSNSHFIRTNPLSVAVADIASDQPLINKDERWKKFFDTYFLEPMRVPGFLAGMKRDNRVPGLTQFHKDRNVAMLAYMYSALTINNFNDLAGLDWDIVSLPTLREQPGIGSQGFPVYMGITRMADNKDASMNVLKFLVTEEFQLDAGRKGITPVIHSERIKQQFGQNSPFKDKNVQALFRNQPAPIPAKPLYDAELVTIYNAALTEILLDKTDRNTALRQAEEKALLKIAEMKQR